MFIRNKTSFPVTLARGNVFQDSAVGAVTVRTEHRLVNGRLVRSEEPIPTSTTDPPSVDRFALWFGASVTAAGNVYAPSSAPFVRAATLTVGAVVQRLLVFGERRWRRSTFGELSATEPQPFDLIPLSFSRAFGGSVDVPPGLFPGTDLPFAGGRLNYVANPGGIGFHLDEAATVGSLLPNIELANQAIKKWSDQPVPGGFSSCPELPALRIQPVERKGAPKAPGASLVDVDDTDDLDRQIAQGFRTLHHAPGYLVFDDLPPGTPVQLEGVGRRTMRFEVPAPPVVVALHRGRQRDLAAPELRSLHLDADHETVACSYGYVFRYNESQAPSWISVESITL